MDIDKKIEAMRERLELSKPVSMTVEFVDGSVTVTDYSGALAIVLDHTIRENVVNITANRSDYAAAAGIMTVLCHPVPNRRIEDYE